MAFSPELTDKIIQHVKLAHPNWDGFDTPSFVRQEIEYKRAASEKARNLLPEAEFTRLLQEGAVEEIVQRLETVGRSSGLLFQSVPQSGDLRLLYIPSLDKQAFCEQMYDLLYGPNDSPRRLQHFVDYLKENQVTPYWTFPTYYLFLLHPESDVFVKPKAMKAFFELVDHAQEWRSRPSGEAYAGVLRLANELRDALASYQPRDMIDVQSVMWVAAMADQWVSVPVDRRQKFQTLFEEFANTYPASEEGRLHLTSYAEMRVTAQTNYERILDKAERGEDITDDVLLKMLPYTDSNSNRDKGAWIHNAPVITGDIRKWFESRGIAKPEDWPTIAQAIFDFVRRSVDNPKELKAACEDFSRSPYSKGLQSGALSPILNALRPDDFYLVNSKPLRVLEYLTSQRYSPQLRQYPAVNKTLHAVVSELTPSIRGAFPSEEINPSDLFDSFCHWMVAIKQFDFKPVRYWRISPGKDAWQWTECVEEGFIAVGWDELGDLSSISRSEFDKRRDELVKKHSWTKTALDQVWRFARQIKEGDKVVANRGSGEVIGIGTVTGPYYFVPDVHHGHRLPIAWEDTHIRKVKGGSGWRRALDKLTQEGYREIFNAPVVELPEDALRDRQVETKPGQPAADLAVNEEAAFSPAAFELLAALHGNPTRAFYLEHKDEFVTLVERPFQAVMQQVAERLPPAITDVMETERRVFGRILKNDFGHGGAWDFYWGAFYPKGGKRTEDAQLSMWMNRLFLEYGFYIGEYGDQKRDRFSRNCNKYPELVKILRDSMPDWDHFVFGDYPEHFDVTESGEVQIKVHGDWEAFLADPAAFGFNVSLVRPRQEALSLSFDELVDHVVRVYEQLFPLILLAVENDPLPAIARYLESDVDKEEIPLNPEYPLSQMAKETGFELATLERWTRAIHRKGQAIFYGPPGTGKTYVAEHLARHLVGGGDGIVEFVQFHPAYAYEDFIQGIRPESDGERLTYPLKPGRFLDFIKEARQRTGVSVLIIDEINRTNLARVFGELMYLLEYRDQKIPLAGGGSLRIPDNVRIIGSMNTADRSIALVDHALRRRFAFLALWPDYNLLRHYHERHDTGFPLDGLISVLRRLNDTIDDRHYEVGISFFLREDLADQIEDIWRMEIEPYLEEYFFDQPGKIQDFRWDKIQEQVLPS